MAVAAVGAAAVLVGAPPVGAIVGGQEVSPKFAYPWMVSLAYNGSHSCGGALISPDTVLTVAHCGIGGDRAWTVRVHRHDLAKPDAAEQGRTYKITRRVEHPDYDPGANHNDVGLWKLERALDVAPLAVARRDRPYDPQSPQQVTVLGWGTAGHGGSVSQVLKEVRLSVRDGAECGLDSFDPTIQTCAGDPGKDSCQGDSGGPAIQMIDGRWTAVGVVSFGTGCGTNNGVNTRLAAYYDWIMDNSR